MRYSYLTINGVRIDHEEQNGLYFEVDYNSGKPNEIGVAKITIYNLSQDVVVGSVISYDFGRGTFGGRFGTFTVKARNVGNNGADTYQELLCSERAIESSNIVSVSLKGQIKSSQAIQEICKSAGLNPVQVDLKEDKVYPTSFSAFGKAMDELKKIANNCSSNLKIEDKEVYFYQDQPKQKQIINLSFESGLIKNPAAAEEVELNSKTSEKATNKEVEAGYNTDDKLKASLTNEFDYTVNCFSIHTLKKGNILSISGTKTFNGVCRIYAVEMNNSKDWTMTLKIKKM